LNQYKATELMNKWWTKNSINRLLKRKR